MTVAGGEDLLDVNVKIGKREPLHTREQRGKGIRFPRRLRV